MIREDILQAISAERDSQDAKWGPIEKHIDKPDIRTVPVDIETEQSWFEILYEEVIEVAQAQTKEERMAELIQVAAVCVKWLEVLNHG